jgi:hypothetical protein
MMWTTFKWFRIGTSGWLLVDTIMKLEVPLNSGNILTSQVTASFFMRCYLCSASYIFALARFRQGKTNGNAGLLEIMKLVDKPAE